METSLALVKATYYDEFDNEERTLYGILQGANMSEVGSELDEWFGKELLNCEVHLLAPGALEITPELYAKLVEEN